MRQNLGIISIVLFTSHLLVIVQQCVGTTNRLECKANKNNVSIWNDKGSCKCSTKTPDDKEYVVMRDADNKIVGMYKFYPEPATWNQARKNCSREGSHLANINSKEDMNRLIELVVANYMIHGPINPSLELHHIWLGIHNHFNEGEWNTVLGGPITYSSWIQTYRDTVQPDNARSSGRCGSLNINWNAMERVDCEWTLNYFCEKLLTCL